MTIKMQYMRLYWIQNTLLPDCLGGDFGGVKGGDIDRNGHWFEFAQLFTGNNRCRSLVKILLSAIYIFTRSQNPIYYDLYKFVYHSLQYFKLGHQNIYNFQKNNYENSHVIYVTLLDSKYSLPRLLGKRFGRVKGGDIDRNGHWFEFAQLFTGNNRCRSLVKISLSVI